MQKLLMLLWVFPLCAMEDYNVWQELKPRTQQQIEAARLKREKALACLLCHNKQDDTKDTKLCVKCFERSRRYHEFLQATEKEVFE